LNSGNWRKSTYSGGQGGQCVEVGQGNGVLVRDTKNLGAGPALRFVPAEWKRFTRSLR
jgi:hypothetical protein